MRKEKFLSLALTLCLLGYLFLFLLSVFKGEGMNSLSKMVVIDSSSAHDPKISRYRSFQEREQEREKEKGRGKGKGKGNGNGNGNGKGNGKALWGGREMEEEIAPIIPEKHSLPAEIEELKMTSSDPHDDHHVEEHVEEREEGREGKAGREGKEGKEGEQEISPPPAIYFSTLPRPIECPSFPSRQVNSPETSPFLLLATTLMDNDGELRKKIQRNTLFALKALEPAVKTVVFTSSIEWMTAAKKIGITVREKFPTNEFGAPFFRGMLGLLEEEKGEGENGEIPLVGFVNGDILFGKDFIWTVRGLLEQVCKGVIGPKVLMIGKRKNTKNIPNLQKDQNPFDTIAELRKTSKTFIKEALDYFIMTRGLYDWKDVNNFPDFVIGRAHYDNAIAVMSLRSGVTIVDGSLTITAIHQNEEHGDFSGDRKERKSLDRHWNLKISNPMGLGFTDLRNGHVGIAHYKTIMTKEGVKWERTEQVEPSSLYPYQHE